MKIWSDSFKDGAKIPTPLAFCKIDATTHAAMSDNRNPHLAWSDLPENTRSLVLICHDYDVPSRGDDVNQEGKTVPADLPRVDFFHWVLIDLPPSVQSIAEARREAKTGRKRRTVPDRASMITRHGLPATGKWKATITDTTAPVHPGTIPFRIITFSRFTRWTLKNSPCPAVFPDRMCWRP